MGWIAHCSCHVLSTGAKYIAFYDMDCILLEMASRWFKMPSRWVQDGPKMPQDGPKMAPLLGHTNPPPIVGFCVTPTGGHGGAELS